MAYNSFTLKKAVTSFNLDLQETERTFAGRAAVPISRHLVETLAENVPLALAMNTEKARSELIIANVLLEVRRIFERRISLFSGIEFNVDRANNLNGFCDFIIGLSPRQLILAAPVIAIVEAKNEKILAGLGQCIAEMVAARKFNQQENSVVERIYGVVTSGNFWRFLKLENETLTVDLDDYHIDQVEKIVGVLCAMVRQEA